MTTHPDSVMTQSQLVAMYSSYPQALAEDLHCVLGLIVNDSDTCLHNRAVHMIERMCPNRDQLILRVAQAILETATQPGEQNGKSK